MSNQEIIKNFYQAFAKGDPEAMVQFYHDDIVFEDPTFGILKGNDAKNMWRLLVSPAVRISFSDVDEHSAQWLAQYTFRKTGRPVINKISAKFEFKDGKIIKHTDYFSFWKWTSQALGMPGYLLGWTGFLQRKLHRQTAVLLKNFDSEKNLKILS